MFPNITSELVIIALLLVANGLFAMAEIAVVSARKSRLRKLAEDGDASSRIALDLAESPSRFLSTVQLGITLVGVLASVFGGATIAEHLATALGRVPFLAPWAHAIGIGSVVIALTLCQVIVGELIPKRIALAAPENVARILAPPMAFFARRAAWIVDALSGCVDGALHLIGAKAVATGPHVTEDDVRILIREGLTAGVLQKAEAGMLEGVLKLDQVPIRDLMTPKPKIVWLCIEDSHDTVWRKIVASNHSYFPVYENNRDNVVGIVSVKAIYANLAAGLTVRLHDLVTAPLLVPETRTAIQLLDTFKQSGCHVAIVTDEFGAVQGLVSLIDLLEAIVGDIPSPEQRLQPEARKRPDGSWLLDATLDLDKLASLFPGITLTGHEDLEIQTAGGFVVHEIGRVPVEGDSIVRGGWRFEVIDMDAHRVDKLLVSPVNAPQPRPAPAPADATPPS